MLQQRKSGKAAHQQDYAASPSRGGMANLALMLFALAATAAYLAILCGAAYYTVAPLLAGSLDLPLVPDLHGRKAGLLVVIAATVAIVMANGIWQVLSRKEDLPDGVEVTRKNGSTLWRAVDKVFEAAWTKPPDKIFLMPEMNAFAAEIREKRYSLKKTRVLGIGYPLLKLLNLEQSAAVIAHEAAHFLGKDNRASRMHFNTLSAAQALICGPVNDRTGLTYLASWILAVPAMLYIRLGSMLGASVSRKNEYRADACAARLFGPRNAADALIVLEVIGEEFTEMVWKPLFEAWRRGTEIPASIMLAVTERAHDETEKDELLQRLDHALEREAKWYDDHPSLAERLERLGADPAIPDFSAKMTGATGLLHDDEDTLRAELDRFIMKEIGDSFEKRRKDIREAEHIVETEMPLIDQSQNPRQAAELLSLLIERSLYGYQYFAMHQLLVDKYGDIPSSLCDLAQEKLEAKDPDGAEEMLAIFENHPLMSGEAKRFLQWANCVREDIPVSHIWLKDWITDENNQKRIEAAFDRHMELVNRYVDIADKRPNPRPFETERWHRDLIVRELCDIWNVRRIWLAEDDRPEGSSTPLIRMLVETVEEQPDYPDVIISSQTCMPGFTNWHASGPIGIAEEPVWRDIRDCDAAMIYENRSVQAKPRKKAA